MYGDVDVFGRAPAMPEESAAALPPRGATAGAAPGETFLGGPAPGENFLGASPDGLGAYARQNGGPPIRHMAQPPPLGPDQNMGATWDWYEPDDVSSDAAVRSAGVTALFTTVAVGTGIAIGGAWGAGAGVLLAGAAVNGYRAQKWWSSAEPSEKHEAVVSAVFSAFGIAIGGYMAYKAYQDRKD